MEQICLGEITRIIKVQLNYMRFSNLEIPLNLVMLLLACFHRSALIKLTRSFPDLAAYYEDFGLVGLAVSSMCVYDFGAFS
jgi:hypothetical protein